MLTRSTRPEFSAFTRRSTFGHRLYAPCYGSVLQAYPVARAPAAFIHPVTSAGLDYSFSPKLEGRRAPLAVVRQ